MAIVQEKSEIWLYCLFNWEYYWTGILVTHDVSQIHPLAHILYYYSAQLHEVLIFSSEIRGFPFSGHIIF